MFRTLIAASIILQIVYTLPPPENKTYTALLKEKGDLYKQINEAINESIAVLKMNNDSEAVLGIQYMMQLKEQLREINGTDFMAGKQRNDTRRRNKITLNMQEIADFLSTKQTGKQALLKKKLSEENKARVQAELDLWLQEMEKEKVVTVKTFKEKSEKCPRFGYGSRKKKKKVAKRRQDGGAAPGPAGPTADKLYNCSSSSEETTTKRVRAPARYPCCRKCCKSSYMGCL